MKKLSTMLLAGVLAIGLFGAGCGDDTNDADNTSTGTGRDSSETFGTGTQALDPVQSLLNDLLAEQLASGAGDTGADAFLEHLSYGLNYILQGPDDLISILVAGDSSQFGSAGTALATNLTIGVNEILCAIGSFAAEDCPSLSTGVPAEFTNLEGLLVSLLGEIENGEGGDLSAVTDILEDVVQELQTLATSEGALPGDPYASSLFELLANALGNTQILLDAIGIEDDAAANAALLQTLDDLLQDSVIGLLQIAESNPALADQIENELSLVTASVNSYSRSLLDLLLEGLLDPLTDALLGGFQGSLV